MFPGNLAAPMVSFALSGSIVRLKGAAVKKN
jgi:hypothetical protein